MKAGDIVIVSFQGAQGVKRRPAVVVSTDLYHRERPDVILGVISTRVGSAHSPTDYLLKDWRAAGLFKQSVFRVYLGTYEQKRVSSGVGSLSERDWREVQSRLRISVEVN